MSEDGFRVPAWHAQHPNRSERYPLCGTVNMRGRPTHRVVKTLDVTCAKCLKALANLKRHNVGGERTQPAAAEPTRKA